MPDPNTVVERTPEQMTAYIAELEVKHENLNKALSVERSEKQGFKNDYNQLLSRQQEIDNAFKGIQANPTPEAVSYFLGIPQDKLTQKEQKVLAHLEEGETVPKGLTDALENLNKKMDERFAQLSAENQATKQATTNALAADKYKVQVEEAMKDFDGYDPEVKEMALTVLVAQTHPSFGGLDMKTVRTKVKKVLDMVEERGKKGIVLNTKEIAEKESKSTAGKQVSLEGDKPKQGHQSIRDIFGKGAISDLESNFKAVGVG